MDSKKVACTLTLIYSVALFTGCATTVDSTESSSQTFENTSNASTDLTSSTSPGGGDEAKAALLLQFAEINFDHLRADMATGKGEHLAAFADLLELQQSEKPAFYRFTKHQFSTLFPSADTTAQQLVTNVHIQMQLANL